MLGLLGDSTPLITGLDGDSLIGVFIVLIGVPYTLWARKRMHRQGWHRFARIYTWMMGFAMLPFTLFLLAQTFVTLREWGH